MNVLESRLEATESVVELSKAKEVRGERRGGGDTPDRIRGICSSNQSL